MGTQGCGFFTKDGMPQTPFPNGWKGENGLYTVGFTRRGLLGTASDAVRIANDVADQWRTIKDCCNSHIILLKNRNKNKLVVEEEVDDLDQRNINRGLG